MSEELSVGWTNNTPSVITVTTVIVEGETGGIFLYSGTPALGNLVASLTSGGSDQTDPYGNNYSEVLDVGGLYLIDQQGNQYQFNSFGATLSFASGVDSVMIRYANTFSATQGGVRWALSGSTQYTDQFGNSIAPALTLGQQVPPTTTGYGELYVADGSNGSQAGALYYLSPAGNVTKLASA